MPVYILMPVCACVEVDVCVCVCPATVLRLPLFVLVSSTQSLIVFSLVFLLWPRPDLGALKGPAALVNHC